MKLKSFARMNCPLAQALDIVGERWTLLVLRDVFFGLRRFEEFQRSLGIARNILTLRLNRLVDEGILARVANDAGSHDYVLTEKGLELQPALLALSQWGERHRAHPDGARLIFVDRDTERPIAPITVRARDGRVLKPRQVKAIAGPALRTAVSARAKRGAEGAAEAKRTGTPRRRTTRS